MNRTGQPAIQYRGRSSAVERQLPKLNVGSSILLARFAQNTRQIHTLRIPIDVRRSNRHHLTRLCYTARRKATPFGGNPFNTGQYRRADSTFEGKLEAPVYLP